MNRQKVILLISNMYPSIDDEIYGIFVENFENQMIQEGFKVQKVVIMGRGKKLFEKIKKYAVFFNSVIRSVKKNDYDLIYVHYMSHSLLSLLPVQKYIKKPVILNAHGSDVFVNNRIGKYIQILVVPIIKKVSAIVVPSSYFKDVVHAKFHIEKDIIFVSPSGGIDINLFRPLNKNGGGNTLIIGFASRIDEGKGWDILLKAVKLLLDNGIVDFKVLMIGGGSQEQLLLKMIETLRIQKNVEYVGKVAHKELVKYYNRMDVFAFTTTRLSESLGLVGLEAMACGVPVIGSDIGGLRGYIENESNGVLFEPGNATELADKLNYFLNMNDDDISGYKSNALKVAKKYDSTIIAKNLSERIFEIIRETDP